MPVLVHVSQATLLSGSSLRQASRIASDTCEQNSLESPKPGRSLAVQLSAAQDASRLQNQAEERIPPGRIACLDVLQYGMQTMSRVDQRPSID